MPCGEAKSPEGTVDRTDYDRGIFDVRTRDRGTISLALPFNAKTSDVDALAVYATATA
jgi:hypothetical protein